MEAINRGNASAALIRQLEDGATNPLTQQPWSAGHTDILAQRRALLVYGQCEDILATYLDHQVFVVEGGTGSGKSTQLPQFLAYVEANSGKRVVCTQPRRVAAKSLATRVAKEAGVTLGEEAGYQIGGDKKIDANGKKTRLAYITEGVLKAQFHSKNKTLEEYACVIVDVVHERTVDADILLGLLKIALAKRKDLKVVIISATVDAQKFQDYFSGCPLVHIAGTNHKVDIFHTQDKALSSDYSIAAARVVIHIHLGKRPGNILVFLPGEAEIKGVCDYIKMHAGTENLDVFPLFGQLSRDQKETALTSVGENRRCILSTNIAETSLTIKGIVFVVDSGLSRRMVYNPRLDMDMLDLRPISQASAKQRTDRAGLTQDGVCYRLYSKEAFDSIMPPSTEPAVLSSRLHEAAVKLIEMKHRRVIDFNWIDTPHPDSIARAAQDLCDWGFLNAEGKAKNMLLRAAFMPADVIWYRAILEGEKLGCSGEIVDIASVCSTQRPIFKRPADHMTRALIARGFFTRQASDHLTLVNVFNMWMLAREASQRDEGPRLDLELWCTMHFVDNLALEEARMNRQKLGPWLKNTAAINMTRVSVTDQTTVRKALARAFMTHAAIHVGGGVYRTVHENVMAVPEPWSVVCDGGYEWVVYDRLEKIGGKVYMKVVTAIDAEWLVDLPYFAEGRVPTKNNGQPRQPQVKKSLDAAKKRIEAAKQE